MRHRHRSDTEMCSDVSHGRKKSRLHRGGDTENKPLIKNSRFRNSGEGH